MKSKFLVKFLLSISALFFANQSFAALNGGNSTVESGIVQNKNFSENAVGASLSLGGRLNLAEDIFTDFEDESSKTKDHIFTEIEAFGNRFFSGEIKQNFGGRLNLGYEIKGFRIYGSGGYLSASVDYQETNNKKQSVNAGAPFFGIGVGYDITKNIGVRLNSMFYNFDFKPNNSEYKTVEVDVSALTLGLAIHF